MSVIPPRKSIIIGTRRARTARTYWCTGTQECYTYRILFFCFDFALAQLMPLLLFGAIARAQAHTLPGSEPRFVPLEMYVRQAVI